MRRFGRGATGILAGRQWQRSFRAWFRKMPELNFPFCGVEAGGRGAVSSLASSLVVDQSLNRRSDCGAE